MASSITGSQASRDRYIAADSGATKCNDSALYGATCYGGVNVALAHTITVVSVNGTPGSAMDVTMHASGTNGFGSPINANFTKDYYGDYDHAVPSGSV